MGSVPLETSTEPPPVQGVNTEQVHEENHAAMDSNAWFGINGTENAGVEMLEDVNLWNQSQWLDTIVTE